MFVRGTTLFLAALLAFGMPGAAAEAGQSSPPPPPEDGSSAPLLLRRIPGIRLLLGDDGAAQDETARSGGNDSNFDESYYEPQPATTPKQKQKQKSTLTAPKAGAAPDASEPGTKAATPAKAAAATAKPPAAGLSCEKAASVVSGYGFSDVAPASCTGKVYAFNAKRDGKSFAIKVDPASGELAEVKKLP